MKLAALWLEPVVAATIVHTQARRLRFCTDGLQLDSSRLNLERKLLDGAAKRVRCSLLEWLLGRGAGFRRTPWMWKAVIGGNIAALVCP